VVRRPRDGVELGRRDAAAGGAPRLKAPDQGGRARSRLIAGTVADALGYSGAVAVVAGLTAASGLWVAADLPAPGNLRRPHARAAGVAE